MQAAHEENALSQQEEEEYGPMPIERLEQVNVGASDIKKLTTAGYHTVEAVAFRQ